MNIGNNPAVATGYSRGAAQVSGNQLPLQQEYQPQGIGRGSNMRRKQG